MPPDLIVSLFTNTDAPLPTMVGPYTIHGRLQSAGPDVVLDASDLDGERVALKLFRPLGNQEERKSRTAMFLRESDRLKRMTHPGVIQVKGAGTIHGCLFLAVKRVLGNTLATYANQKRLESRAVRALGAELASTLCYLHRFGFTARDLQPASTLVDVEGHPVITSLVSSLVAEVVAPQTESCVIGSPGLLAPELLKGWAPSPLSDQYALGRLLESLLDSDAKDVLFLEILGRMTEADPAERYQSFSTCWEALANEQETWCWSEQLTQKMESNDCFDTTAVVLATHENNNCGVTYELSLSAGSSASLLVQRPRNNGFVGAVPQDTMPEVRFIEPQKIEPLPAFVPTIQPLMEPDVAPTEPGLVEATQLDETLELDVTREIDVAVQDSGRFLHPAFTGASSLVPPALSADRESIKIWIVSIFGGLFMAAMLALLAGS